MHKKYKNLIIIGNGFDRWQGLPTSYGNFIDYYNLHIEQILKKLHVKKLKIKNPDGKKQKINPVDLIYSNPINPKPLEDEFFWNFEQSVALLDDHLINLSFGKSNRGLRKLRRTVQQAQKILRTAFSDWIHSIVVPDNPTGAKFSNDCYFINFNYTDTLEKFFGVNPLSINHIHGYADDSESIIVGHATHPEYPFVELLEQKFIKPKSQRLKGLYYVESALYETDKHIQDNIDDMCEFMVLDGVDIEQIENIYVLGHSFGEQDFEYFDFLEKVTKVGCNYNELSALWKVHHIGLEELTEESIFEDIRLNLLYAQHHRERELGKKDDLFPEYTLIEKILDIDKVNVYTEEIANKAAEAVKKRFIFEQALRTKHVLEEICILKHIEEIPESAECASVFKLADYIDGRHEKRKINAKWHISYFNDEDKIRIANVMHRIGCTDYELIHGIDECIKKVLR
ncbi:MAG: bacteriophage abortive infection AbiH family protein [Treponema sp.]|nr:bacteriophage abortive infection AbiH family protein [Treponema sp.]